MSIFPTKILLATDGSEEAVLAAQAAEEIAQNSGSELHVVHVGDEYHPGLEIAVSPTLLEETLLGLERKARDVLDEQVKKIEEAGVTIAEAYLRMGKPDREIVALAEEIGVGLIVLGSRGLGGIRRALMGSVSSSVVCHAYCPVLVVRAEKDRGLIFSLKSVLLATDGSEEANLAAKLAADIAGLFGSELYVVHVEEYPPPHLAPGYGPFTYTDAETIQRLLEAADSEAKETLEEQVDHIRSAGGSVARSYLRQGRPHGEVVNLAEEIGVGLIIVGSRGLGGFRRALMGSVSDSVVRHAHCPVLVVRKQK